MDLFRRRTLADILPNQRDHVDTLLRRQGIAESRFGAELEFSLHPNPNINRDAAQGRTEQLREEAIRHLQKKGGRDATTKIEALRQFNGPELVMFALHEMEPSTRDILEPAFGNGRDDRSYYDVPGVLEAKIKPCDSAAFAQRLKAVHETLNRVATEIGLKPVPAFWPHLNVSFWQDGKNLCDPAHPEFTTTAARLFRGVHQAIADGRLLTELEESDFLSVNAGIDRNKNIRITGEGERGRIEVRLDPPPRNKAYDLPLIIEGIVKSGALHGLTAKSPPSVNLTKRGVFSRKGESFKNVTQVLQGSEAVATGTPGEYRLIPPKDYLQAITVAPVYQAVAEELGLRARDEEAMDESRFPALLQHDKSENPEDIRRRQNVQLDDKELEALTHEFWRKVKIDGSNIMWPADEEFMEFYRKRRELFSKGYVSAEALVDIFSNTRLIERADGGFDIRWPATKRMGGSDWPLAIPNLQQFTAEVHCSAIADAFTAPDIKKEGRAKDLLLRSPTFKEGRLRAFTAALDRDLPTRSSPFRS